MGVPKPIAPTPTEKKKHAEATQPLRKTHLGIRRPPFECIALVLQGGGALGAFQAGVYQGLAESNLHPDWVAGISIGAINAALIAGNPPEKRVEKLQAFWGTHAQLGPERAGYYSTDALGKTLAELADFSLVNSCKPRLTVGAAHVRTSQMRYFDSRDMPLGAEHILASGALPPAFPAVRIDGELYWDGGILSNTPTEVIFDDNPRKNSLIFAVHMWNPVGPEPETMWEVMHRQKDIQYSSRVSTHIARQLQSHRLRHVIKELLAYVPEEERNSEAVRELAGWGCLTRMHVVRLLAPRLDNEDHTKDVDFSPDGIRRRWEAGYVSTQRAIEQKPWQGEFDPLEGVILHEPREDARVEKAADLMIVTASGAVAFDTTQSSMMAG